MATRELPRPPRRAAPPPPDRPGLRRLVRFALLFLACVVIVDAVAGDKGLIELMQARRQHATLEGQIQALREENARLRAEAQRLREDPGAIEEIARRELGLIRPGELLFIVTDRVP